MKRNLLEAYMEQVKQEGRKNGVEFNETIKNDTSDFELSESKYVQDLENNAMMSEDIFRRFENKFNIDWDHVKQVSDVAEAKELLKQMKKKEEEREAIEHNEKIRQIALNMLKQEADKLK